MKKQTNAYNIINPDNPGTVIYHAIASDEKEVMSLAEKNGIDITGLMIGLERTNVRTELGSPAAPKITDAIIR